MWNNPNDPMPIKTMNNNGLKVLEEVPGEYKIYIDKDAVMTTVAKYAPGSYQTFTDRKADVDNSRSLLRGYNIEWTQKDDSDLFIQCNNEAISKIENQPMTLDEPTQPVVLEPKTVPTTYECCFRVDKKSGEIYIGEGYENLWSLDEVKGVTNVAINQNSNHYKITYDSKTSTEFNFIRSGVSSKFNGIDSYTGSVYMLEKKENSYVMFRGGFKAYNSNTYAVNTYIGNLDENIYLGIGVKSDFIVGDSLEAKHFQITKTSTPKPFVKSVMPSGKLAFVTPATSETHSFVMRNFARDMTQSTTAILSHGNNAGGEYFTDSNNSKDFLASKSYSNKAIYNQGVGNANLQLNYWNSRRVESFFQLLIYKANLTETELKTELAKDIKLI